MTSKKIGILVIAALLLGLSILFIQRNQGKSSEEMGDKADSQEGSNSANKLDGSNNPSDKKSDSDLSSSSTSGKTKMNSREKDDPLQAPGRNVAAANDDFESLFKEKFPGDWNFTKDQFGNVFRVSGDRMNRKPLDVAVEVAGIVGLPVQATSFVEKDWERGLTDPTKSVYLEQQFLGMPVYLGYFKAGVSQRDGAIFMINLNLRPVRTDDSVNVSFLSSRHGMRSRGTLLARKNLKLSQIEAPYSMLKQTPMSLFGFSM
ncbi:MAG: hypothetical protein IPL83_00150 [Bdellovibrionales bacterium]|nr:hypothetical protein [Bdellovibrionales bacterium]